MEISLGTKIILILIILHFIAGFGYLAVKLSGKPKDSQDLEEEEKRKKSDNGFNS